MTGCLVWSRVVRTFCLKVFRGIILISSNNYASKYFILVSRAQDKITSHYHLWSDLVIFLSNITRSNLSGNLVLKSWKTHSSSNEGISQDSTSNQNKLTKINQNKHWHECCSHTEYLAWVTAWLWVHRIEGVQLNTIWFCRIMNYKFGLLPGLASLLTDWALISGSVRCAPYYCARSFERPDVAHVLPVDLLSSNLL